MQEYVCFWRVFVSLENFSLIRRRHHNRWRSTHFSTLMATEPWGFLNNVPHILWYGPTFIMVISEKTRDTLTCCRAFGNGAICFKDLGLYRPGIEPRSLACGANALPLRQRGNNIIQSIKKKVRPLFPLSHRLQYHSSSTYKSIVNDTNYQVKVTYSVLKSLLNVYVFYYIATVELETHDRYIMIILNSRYLSVILIIML